MEKQRQLLRRWAGVLLVTLLVVLAVYRAPSSNGTTTGTGVLTVVSSPAVGSSAAALPDGPVLASYAAPDGMEIVSHHPGWTDERRLKGIWDELMRNTHFGEERYLRKIHLWPGDFNSFYSGVLVWSDGRITMSDQPEINLFPGEATDPTDPFLAYSIAHEYGHHFTLYYLVAREGNDLETNWRKSGYARIRGLPSDRRVKSEKEGGEHSWRPVEMAAEDYRQLFGSPNARRFVRIDTTNPAGYRLGTWMYNIHPQDNGNLPLAAQVPGLQEYWLKLARASDPASANGYALPRRPPSPPVLAVTGKPSSPYTNAIYLDFAWTPSRPASGGVEYSLLEYKDADDVLGTPLALTAEPRARATIMTDRGPRTRYYRVLAKDDSGLVVTSELLSVNIDRPTFSRPPAFYDLAGHWARDQAEKLVEKGAIGGYPDGSFRPEAAITRAEFLKILVAAAQLDALAPKAGPRLPDLPGDSGAAVSGETALSTHWAKSYLETAVALDLIRLKDYTGGFDPDAPATREEIGRMVGRLIPSPTLRLTPPSEVAPQSGVVAAFPDWDDTRKDWRPYVEAAVTRGILQGYPDGTFQGRRSATRAEAAAIVLRTLGALGKM